MDLKIQFEAKSEIHSKRIHISRVGVRSPRWSIPSRGAWWPHWKITSVPPGITFTQILCIYFHRPHLHSTTTRRCTQNRRYLHEQLRPFKTSAGQNICWKGLDLTKPFKHYLWHWPHIFAIDTIKFRKIYSTRDMANTKNNFWTNPHNKRYCT